MQHVKTPGRGSIQPPSPPPRTTVGVWICVYVQGLNTVSQMKTQVRFKSNESSTSE